jgi:exopolyphosphatase/guanosine-5'-triphosphate,3'-diphosphate pyrophosphatase
MSKIAIIDIGSRSCVLEVFAVKGDSFKQIHHSSHATFLGKDISRNSDITDGAIELTRQALTEFANTITMINEKQSYTKNNEDIKIYAVCTQAIRIARNQSAVLDMIKDTLPNADVKVITGDEEAIYSFLGVINSTDMRDFVMLDTGGASSEIALVKDRKLCKFASIPYGAVNITEKFLGSVIVPNHRLSEAIHTILPEFASLDWMGEATGLPIIVCGSSGRNLALAEMSKKITNGASLHGYMINASNVDFIVKQIAKMSASERVQKLGIKRSSAEIILGGLVPLMAVFKAVSSKRMYYSETGLRYGVFYEKFAKMQKMQTPIEPNVLSSSIKRLQVQYKANKQHAENVETLVLQIFDQTQNLHHLGERFRKILSVSALLHDVGEYIQYNNHHEHSYYIIKESDIYALEHQDKLYSAIITGYHNKTKFDFSWLKYWRFVDTNTLKKLKSLGKMIYISEKILEKQENIDKIKLQIAPQTIQVIVDKTHNISYNDHITRLFGRKVYLV